MKDNLATVLFTASHFIYNTKHAKRTRVCSCVQLHTSKRISRRGADELQHFSRAVPSKRSFQSPPAGRTGQSAQCPTGARRLLMGSCRSWALVTHQPELSRPCCCSLPVIVQGVRLGLKAQIGYMHICVFRQNDKMQSFFNWGKMTECRALLLQHS